MAASLDTILINNFPTVLYTVITNGISDIRIKRFLFMNKVRGAVDKIHSSLNS